jgi:DNA polymerase-4
MPRTILHLDLDAFFCAVEELLNPALKGKAFAVGGRPEERGVVASCSYAARAFGVRSAMPMSTAVQRCPDLLIVSRRMGKYSEVSRRVMAILHDLTPLVEQLSIDEAFLDVTGLPGSGESIARQLQARINDELQLPCSLGVASNKLVAKIANNIGKDHATPGQPPNAITLVLPGEEASFLAPLSIRELWGVGPKTAERLNAMGVQTIGDLTRFSEQGLTQRFGKLGHEMYYRARGIDNRPIETEHETKSISAETTFVHDVRDEAHLKRTLRELADEVGRRVRKHHLRGKTVTIKLRWSDFTTLTRQTTLPQPIDSDEAIYVAAVALLDKAWSRGRPVRLIGVGLSGFDVEVLPQQLGLWDAAPLPEPPRENPLQDTLDKLRERFGDDAIKRGSDLQD